MRAPYAAKAAAPVRAGMSWCIPREWPAFPSPHAPWSRHAARCMTDRALRWNAGPAAGEAVTVAIGADAATAVRADRAASGLQLADTIVAISTPPGRAGLGIVRLSGAQARAIAAQFLVPCEWRPWQAHMAQLLDSRGHPVDQAVVTFFAAPRSYTAEDLVEIACHGSPV